MSASLAIAAVALVAVLPEYVIEAVLAWMPVRPSTPRRER